ncbi:hypothetical protein Ciccas_011681 [Cichlidogyrus casuarinus]|uniref:Cilia- and flagella-associated protein 263 n=1 Tax=Cichlidogyrus casuarinus TaxID=1844966 RepID=A0ABD2PRW5_9PLAT
MFLKKKFTHLASKEQDEAKTLNIKKKQKRRSDDKKARLTNQQRMLIYRSEVEEIKTDIEKLAKSSNKIANTYAAILEEGAKRLHEIKKFWFEFDREVVKDGYSERFKTYVSEAFVKYMNNYIKQRDTLQDKLQLANVSLRARIAKFRFQLQKKEEMGEDLHEVDFDQLKIENAQFLARIDEKNQELLQLKLQGAKFAFNLNRDKAILKEIQSQDDSLRADFAKWADLINLIDAETLRAQQEIDQETQRNKQLKARLESYKAPSVRDYISLVNDRTAITKNNVKLEHGLNLIKIDNQQQMLIWKELKEKAYLTS